MADWKKYKDKVKSIANGRVAFIDPNSLCCYTNNEGDPYVIDDSVDGVANKIRFPWNLEDYCIDVDLIMEVRSRGDYAYSENDIYYLHYQNKGNNLSLMSGKRFYYGNNKMSDNASLKANLDAGSDIKTGKFVNYLSTTDYDATYQDVLNDYISTEMLGIESIDISYVNAFCPLVTLKMKDVRGLGLMSTTERNHTKSVDGITGYARADIVDSFYSALNALPYPKVSLRVKGLYGAPTVYDLTFSKKSDSFDPNLGCWTMTIELIGYAYSFLTEVPILQALTSPSCPCAGGSQYWEDVIMKDPRYALSSNGVPTAPLKWMNLVKEMMEANDELQKMRQNGEGKTGELGLLDDLSVSLKNLKTAANAIVNSYANFAKDSVIGCAGGSVLFYGSNNGGALVAYTNMDETNGFFSMDIQRGKFADWTLSSESDVRRADFTIISANVETWKSSIRDLTEKFEKVGMQNNPLTGATFALFYKNQQSAIENDQVRFSDDARGVLNGIDGCLSGNAKSYISQKYSTDSEKMGLVEDIKARYVLAAFVRDQSTGVYSLFETECNKILSEIDEKKKALDVEIKKEEVSIEAKHLGFDPTLRNVVKLIMMHCENYFNMIYSASDTIASMSRNGDRTVDKAGLTHNNSDFKTDSVPPFPSFMTRQKDTNAQDWIGKLPYQVFKPEVDLVNALLNATSDVERGVGNGYSTNGDAMSNANRAVIPFDGVIPLCFTDLMVGMRPFIGLLQSDFDSIINNGDISQLITALWLRKKLVTLKDCSGTLDNADLNLTAYGKADAQNLASSARKNNIHFPEGLADKIEAMIGEEKTDAEIFKTLDIEGGDCVFDIHKDMDANKALIKPQYIESQEGSIKKAYIPSNTQSTENQLKRAANLFENYNGNPDVKWKVFGDPSVVSTSEGITIEKQGDLFKKLYSGELHGAHEILRNYIWFDSSGTIANNIQKPSSLSKTQSSCGVKFDNSKEYPIGVLLNKFDSGLDASSVNALFNGIGVLESDAAMAARIAREKVVSDNVFNIKSATDTKSKLMPSLNLLYIDSSDRDLDGSERYSDENFVTHANLFLSNYYYGIRSRQNINGYQSRDFYRANFFLFHDTDCLGRINIKETDITIVSPLLDGDKMIETLKSGTVSRKVLLQMGAACWMKFVMNPILKKSSDDVILWGSNLDIQNKYGRENFGWGLNPEFDGYRDDRKMCRYILNWFEGSNYNVNPKLKAYYEMVWFALADYYERWVITEFMPLQRMLEIPSLNETNIDTVVENLTKLHKAVFDAEEDKEKQTTALELFGDASSSYKLRTDLDYLGFCDYRLLFGIAAEVTDEVYNRLKSFTEPVIATSVFFPEYIEKEDRKTIEYSSVKTHGNYAYSLLKEFAKIVKEDAAFKDEYADDAVDATVVQNPTDALTPVDSKISVYYSIKRLWDKWLGGCQRSSAKDGARTNWLDIDFINNKFHFIDTFYNEIGDSVYIDMNNLMTAYVQTISQHQNWSLLTFLNHILGQSRIQLHCIQNFADLSKPDTVAQAFVPMTFYESHNLDSYKNGWNSAVNSDFVCIYSYEPSHTIGCVTDDPKREYTGDGFLLTDNLAGGADIPSFCNGLGGQWAIPAFAVTYGSQYQSYFTNINAKIDSNNNTEYAMIASLQLAQMGSDKLASQTKFIGQDLYTIQSNQSFTVDVEMVGCAWIQPLMYFVLTNIPMYRGTYIIQKVSHTITAGLMKTKFTGVKMSRFANKLVDSPYMSQFIDDNYRDSRSATERNLNAGLDNDCAYKVFTPSVDSNPSKSWENTVNVDALKEYKPFYVERAGYANLWDALCCIMEAECGIPKDTDSDRLKMLRKLTYLAMFNSHAEYAQNKGYQKRYEENLKRDDNKDVYIGAWHQMCCNAFAASFGGSKKEPSNRAATEQYLEAVLKNPIGSVLGGNNSLDVSVGEYTFHRCTKDRKYVGDPQYAKNLPSYFHGTARGVISDVASIDADMLRRFNMYSIPYEYADEIHKGNHHDADYKFAYMASNDIGHIFLCGSARSGALWTEEQLSDMSEHPITDNTGNKSLLSSPLILAFLKALQKSMDVTMTFNGDRLLNSKTGKEPKEGDFVDDYAMISCKDRKNNATLFDMITRGNDDGYYGWCDTVVWCSDAACQTAPNYILVHACQKTDIVKPKFYFHVIGSADNTALSFVNEGIAKRFMESNAILYDDNGANLSTYPESFWKAFKKNVKPIDTPTTNKALMSFSYSFGGSDYVVKNWGQTKGANENQICYYLDKTQISDCEDMFDYGKATTPSECEKFNKERTRKRFIGVKYEDIFKELNSPVLTCSVTNKLKDVSNGGQWHGPLDDPKQCITSGYGSRTVKKKVSGGKTIEHKGFHYGLDIASFTPSKKVDLIAPYDGICTDVFYTNKGYGFAIVGILNIQNSDGEWLAFLSGHHDSPDEISIRGGQSFKAGQKLGKIGKRADGINYCTGVHSHFQTCWVSKKQCADKDGNFIWKERYGGPNTGYLINKDKTYKPFDLRNYVELLNFISQRGKG